MADDVIGGAGRVETERTQSEYPNADECAEETAINLHILCESYLFAEKRERIAASSLELQQVQ